MTQYNPVVCDIHNHILYGVDDGSKDMKQSLRMLDIAKGEGTTAIILTPHHCRRYFKTDRETVLAHYAELRKAAARKYPDIELYLGSEVYVDNEALSEMEQGTLLTMAGSRYLLIEFEVTEPYQYIRNAVTIAAQNGYFPILAHVERYKCLTDSVDRVYELKDQGAYIQINASSVTGENGRKTKSFVKGLLKDGAVDFIATDAHRDDKRKPLIRECYKYVVRKFGSDYATRIFADNPRDVIEDRCI